jgi:hypothetical protein
MTKFTQHLLFFLLMLTVSAASAQNLTPEAVTSVGVKMTQSNGSLSFTVGELVVEPMTDANGNTLGGGFTSGAANSTTVLPVTLPESEVLSVNVYPNPTADMLTVDVQHASLDRFVLELNDVFGKLLYTGTYAGMSNRIGVNLSQYSAGSYILNLRQTDGLLLGTFRVVRQ